MAFTSTLSNMYNFSGLPIYMKCRISQNIIHKIQKMLLDEGKIFLKNVNSTPSGPDPFEFVLKKAKPNSLISIACYQQNPDWN